MAMKTTEPNPNIQTGKKAAMAPASASPQHFRCKAKIPPTTARIPHNNNGIAIAANIGPILIGSPLNPQLFTQRLA